MNVEAIVQGIRANGHAKVLVVGARGMNFPPVYHRHPQIVIWETEYSAKLPEAVRLIIPLRFQGHALWKKLVEKARRRNIVMLGLKGTGEAKRILAPLMVKEAAPEMAGVAPLVQASPAAQATPLIIEAALSALSKESEVNQTATAVETIQSNNHQPRESLRAWLDRNINWGPLDPQHITKGAKTNETRRLHKLALDSGYVSATEGGVGVEVGRMWRLKYAAVVKAAKPGPKPKKQAQPPATKRPVGRPQTNGLLSDDDRNVLKLVEEAKAALDLVAGAIKAKAVRKGELIQQLRGF